MVADSAKCLETANNALEMDKPKMTNGDRIRAMSDEELAKLLDRLGTCGCKNCTRNRMICDTDCEQGILEYLKTETKDNG